MFKEENLKKTFIILMMLYPLFGIKFFYNSYFTLIQIGIIMILFIWLLAINKSSRKNIKWLILYEVLLIGYAILHHMNAVNFTSLVPGNFNYSALKEILYLIKLNIPIIFVYILFYLRLNKTEFIKIIKWWIILISGSIVVTNILGISLGSYSDELIKGNIFTWFNQDFIYRDLASKGYFMYANQISCLSVVLIPFITYFYLKNKLKLYYLLILMLSLLMLGTRVANIGSILVLFVIVSLYLFFSILKKEKIERKKVISIFFIIVLYAFLLPFSPTIGRDNIYEYILKENSRETLYASNNDELLTDINYIKDNYEKKLINKEFITRSYPYQYDPSFWLNILNEPEEKRADYRFLEISMVKRVIEINNNKLDLWFGLTNSRIQNIFNIERDYILQYYAFGLIGFILLIGVYFIIFIKSIKNLIKNFNFYNICLVSSFALFLVIAYMSGNIMNQISIFVPLLFIICQNIAKTVDSK